MGKRALLVVTCPTMLGLAPRVRTDSWDHESQRCEIPRHCVLSDRKVS